MTLVHNERTKLTANSLDRLSTACAAAGFIAPAASFANSTGTFQITWAWSFRPLLGFLAL